MPLLLKKQQLNWLLESDNPMVKYITLTNLLQRPEDHFETLQARKEIMETEIVKRLLKKQNVNGYWVSQNDFYQRTKYKGTVWTFLILAELFVNGSNEQIQKAFEYLMEMSFHRESGGFAYRTGTKGGGRIDSIIPCLTANMVFAMVRFGYFSDKRVQKAIQWLTKYQRFDDGNAECPSEWPYEGFERCWGHHTCYSSVVRTLKALVEIPEGDRIRSVKQTIEKCVDFILRHQVYKQSHNPGKTANENWMKLGFPLMWEVDILEILLLLCRLNCKDKRMKDAVTIILSKQQGNGKWIQEKIRNGRHLVVVEPIGQPSKWITVRSLTVLKHWFT